jgi:hypothetical protein
MIDLVSEPTPLMENSVDGIERVEVGLEELENLPNGVPIDGDLIVTVGALEHEWVGEAGHGSVRL